ncbi:MAG: hypothetical protein LJE62_02965 [Silicimonas sp.]|nr:hypothetical protein [Silicimonas sp.]
MVETVSQRLGNAPPAKADQRRRSGLNGRRVVRRATWLCRRAEQFILWRMVDCWIMVADLRHRKELPEYRLPLIWKYLSRAAFFQWLLGRLRVLQSRAGRRSILLDRIIARKPELSRAVRLHVPAELSEALDTGDAPLFLQVHELHLSLTLLFARQRRQFVRLVGNPERHGANLSARGIDLSLVHFVKNDGKSLLALRDCLKLGLPICCAVDFSARRRKFGFVSPAMFEFAVRRGIPTFYVKSLVTEDGEIRLDCLPLGDAIDGNEAARDFLEFVNADMTASSQLEIGEYQR